ncbi:holo-ACP synthase [Phytoactinopolyspora halotolerans]|uniref:Holo-[acyl-carrier-protein] synthase n=1 Tax=Phytoactinopolyspora halotolerans TaxID=1981512 RepID=A0A6L9S1T1_9ACTN|nr:holo-ACP synthase [Phytoactinopolyspora halotolerans]NED99165.1 holo-[acyl-carrier-protein] synthase [Phytoactinopolyspora halotolerans]
MGVDLVQVSRMRRLLDEQPAAQAELFTPRELAACGTARSRYARLAARFAAKEAVLKAFGTGLGPRMAWHDVEIVNEPWGRPVVILHGERMRSLADRLTGAPEISMSHTGDVALAHAVIVMRPRPVAARPSR